MNVELGESSDVEERDAKFSNLDVQRVRLPVGYHKLVRRSAPGAV